MQVLQALKGMNRGCSRIIAKTDWNAGHTAEKMLALSNMADMFDRWDTIGKESIPKPRVKPKNLDNLLEYLMDEGSDGTVITKKMIGEELVDEGLNTADNLQYVVSFLIDAGCTVK